MLKINAPRRKPDLSYVEMRAGKKRLKQFQHPDVVIDEVRGHLKQVYNNLNKLNKSLSSRNVSASRERTHRSIENIVARADLRQSDV